MRALFRSPRRSVLYANPAFARMVGLPLDQIVSSDLTRFVPAQQRESLARLIVQSSREAVRAEMMLLSSSRGDLPARFSFNPTNLDAGLSGSKYN
jgi:PAS domain-containing protein